MWDNHFKIHSYLNMFCIWKIFLNEKKYYLKTIPNKAQLKYHIQILICAQINFTKKHIRTDNNKTINWIVKTYLIKKLSRKIFFFYMYAYICKGSISIHIYMLCIYICMFFKKVDVSCA